MKPNFSKNTPYTVIKTSGPADYHPLHSLPSNYTGVLASDNYFSQKEINTKPTKRINAALAKRGGPEVKKDAFGADYDELESMRASTTSFEQGRQVEISDEQKERIRSRPFSGKYKAPIVKEENYEEIEGDLEVSLEESDRESMRKSFQNIAQERENKINEFQNYLENMKHLGSFGNDLDQLVDENQSREELEKQVMDNNYMKDKIEEHRMNSSFHSEGSNGPVKAISFGNSTKPNLYKPPMRKSSQNKAKHTVEEENLNSENDVENIEDIQARIAKQLEGFHKQKQLALED